MPSTSPFEGWKQESLVRFFIRETFRTLKANWMTKAYLAVLVLLGLNGLSIAMRYFIAGDGRTGWVSLAFSLLFVAIVPLVIVANRWQRMWDITCQEYLLEAKAFQEALEKEAEAVLAEERFEAGHTQDCQLLLDRVAEDYALDADQREDLIDGRNELIDAHEMSIGEFNEALQAFFLPNDSPGLSDDESAAFRRIVEGFGPEPT